MYVIARILFDKFRKIDKSDEWECAWARALRSTLYNCKSGIERAYAVKINHYILIMWIVFGVKNQPNLVCLHVDIKLAQFFTVIDGVCCQNGKKFFLFSTLSWYSITLHGIYNILSHYNVTPLYSHRASNVSKIALKRVELNENKEEKKCLRLSGSDLSLSLTLSLHIGCKCVFCCCFFFGKFCERSEANRLVCWILNW